MRAFSPQAPDLHHDDAPGPLPARPRPERAMWVMVTALLAVAVGCASVGGEGPTTTAPDGAPPSDAPAPSPPHLALSVTLAAGPDRPEGLDDVLWSPDGARIAAVDHQNAIKLWDSRTGDLATRLAIDPAGWLMAETRDDVVMVWHLYEQQLVRWFTPHPVDTAWMGWTPGGEWLITAGCDEAGGLLGGCTRPTVKFWGGKLFGLDGTLETHDERIDRVALSPDGQALTPRLTTTRAPRRADRASGTSTHATPTKRSQP